MPRFVVHLLLIISLLSAMDKKTVAILDLNGIGITESEAQLFTLKLRNELVDIGEYLVLERAEMDQILREQGLQQSGCITSECVVQVGQILGVSHIISGSVGRMGELIYCETKLVNVETSEIEKSVDEHRQGNLEGAFIYALPRLAYQLCDREMPQNLHLIPPESGYPQVTIPQVAVPKIDQQKKAEILEFEAAGLNYKHHARAEKLNLDLDNYNTYLLYRSKRRKGKTFSGIGGGLCGGALLCLMMGIGESSTYDDSSLSLSYSSAILMGGAGLPIFIVGQAQKAESRRMKIYHKDGTKMLVLPTSNFQNNEFGIQLACQF